MAAKYLQKVLHTSASKTPGDLVKKVTLAVKGLGKTSTERQQEELSKLLAGLKATLYGEAEGASSRESTVLLCYEATKLDLPALLIDRLALLEFEARKDATQVCSAIFRMGNNQEGPGATYVKEHPELLTELFDGYDQPAVALNCGTLLRDCARDEGIARLILESPVLFPGFLRRVEMSNFEVASDAFATFKDLLTRHTALVARFLQAHHDEVFAGYNKLLQSENYVTRRQSLKLLGELLLEPSNTKVMERYTSNPDNLKLQMNLLRDSSRSIQYEAFHVFKVFVANPRKVEGVVEILATNRDKLLAYLSDFHSDKDDEQFKDEKAIIVREISTLQVPAGAQTSLGRRSTSSVGRPEY